MNVIEKFCVWYLTRRNYAVCKCTANIPGFIQEMRGAK